MKKYLESTKRLLLLITPMLTSSVLATSPSQAATFASSQGELEFTDFSQSPLNIKTDTDTNTVTIAKNGMVQAEAGATAFFITTPPEAFDLSVSEAFGKGREYLGQAESEAKVLGDFIVDAGQQFSFDFAAKLNLKTSIDNPPAENARANGDISFVLLDTDNKRVLDFFSLVGNINTEGDDDFIATQKSDDVTLSTLSKDSHFGGQQESATASVEGSLHHSFDNKTNLALVEVKRTEATVKAPEPSSSLALLFCSGVIGIALKGRRNTTTSACLCEENITAES